MAAPEYSSASYDAAANKYRELQSEYTGETGYKKADTQAKQTATEQAVNAGSIAGSQAASAARTAGMSRSKSAALASQAAANGTLNSYNNAYNSAMANSLNNNQNAVNSQSQLMQLEQQKDTNRYNSAANKWGAGMGVVGGAFNGVANALSDENKKCIKSKTDVSSRCDELIERLNKGKK